MCESLKAWKFRNITFRLITDNSGSAIDFSEWFSVFFLWPYFQICIFSLKTLIQKANNFYFHSDQKVIANTLNHCISEQITNLNKECKLIYTARIPVNSLPSNEFILYHQFRYSVQDRFNEYHQHLYHLLKVPSD